MSNIKDITDYIKHTRYDDLTWVLNDVTAVLTVNSSELHVSTYKNNELLLLKIFESDESILNLINYLILSTGDNQDATTSVHRLIINYINDISSLVENYHLDSTWLIKQYESGNIYPLINRTQTIVSDLNNSQNGNFKHDAIVYQYYKTHVSEQALENARIASTNLRVALSKISVAHLM